MAGLKLQRVTANKTANVFMGRFSRPPAGVQYNALRIVCVFYSGAFICLQQIPIIPTNYLRWFRSAVTYMGAGRPDPPRKTQRIARCSFLEAQLKLGSCRL